MELRRLLAFLAALVALLLIASGLAGLPAALSSPGAIAVASVCVLLVVVGVAAGRRGGGPRTTYW
ncbi:MAG: hypothetical protein ABEH81_05610 [Halopenitus sp.]